MKKLFIPILLLILACTDDEENICEPTQIFKNVELAEASYTSIRISGSINTSDCSDNIITKGVVISENGIPTVSSRVEEVENNNDNFDLFIDELKPNTVYNLRAFLINELGEFYSELIKVETLNNTILFTNIQSNPSISSVEISVDYDFLEGNGYSISDKGVELEGKKYFNLPNNEMIKVQIEDLQPNTNYTFKAFIKAKSNETFYSNESSFKTEMPQTTISQVTVSEPFYDSFELKTSYTNLYSGEDISTEKGFLLSLDSDFSNSTKFISKSSNQGVINAKTSQLKHNTNYFVKAYVENSYGTDYSETVETKTLNAGYTDEAPVANKIDFTSADLYTQVIVPIEGTYADLPIIEKGFHIATDENFTSNFKILKDEITNNYTEASFSVANLEPNTTYFFKTYVINKYMTYTSKVSTFKTLETGYNYTNLNSSKITYSTAKITGKYAHINSQQVNVDEIGFYISENQSNLDSSTPIEVSDSELSLTIDKLNHNTNYYYQAYVKNEFGEFKSEIKSFKTLDATPNFNFSVSNNNINFSSVNPDLNINLKENTGINSLKLTYAKVGSNNNDFIDILSQVSNTYQGGGINFQINNLEPNTTYELKINLSNDYDEFESQIYSFITLDDTPSVTYTVSNVGVNSVEVVSNFDNPSGAEVKRAYLEYKNQEENNYSRIELDTKININTIDNLVQGPDYEFKLTVINEWNTFTYNKYMFLPVTYKVGDEMFGGVIVYIDASGYHGIIASEMKDMRKLKWSTNKDLEEDFNLQHHNHLNSEGKENTQLIVNYFKNTQWNAPAAEYCNNFMSDGYDDWFLPSVDEFEFNKKIIQKNMYEKYGSEFLREYNVLWTSNEDRDISSRASRIKYNGCHANFCVTGYNKEGKFGVLPIRFF